MESCVGSEGCFKFLERGLSPFQLSLALHCHSNGHQFKHRHSGRRGLAESLREKPFQKTSSLQGPSRCSTNTKIRHVDDSELILDISISCCLSGRKGIERSVEYWFVERTWHIGETVERWGAYERMREEYREQRDGSPRAHDETTPDG